MNMMLGIFSVGGGQIILIILLILIFFGAKKIPELAKGLGQGIKEFKKATREVTDEIQNASQEESNPIPPKKIEEKAESEKAASAPQSAEKRV